MKLLSNYTQIDNDSKGAYSTFSTRRLQIDNKLYGDYAEFSSRRSFLTGLTALSTKIPKLLKETSNLKLKNTLRKPVNNPNKLNSLSTDLIQNDKMSRRKFMSKVSKLFI